MTHAAVQLVTRPPTAEPRQTPTLNEPEAMPMFFGSLAGVDRSLTHARLTATGAAKPTAMRTASSAAGSSQNPEP